MESAIGEQALDDLCEIAASAPAGALVEFGVWKGGSAVRLAEVARAKGQPLYLYDTFCGIPYADPGMGDSHRVGDFGDTSEQAVRELIPDAIVSAGVFPASLVKMPPIGFVHVDADQYESVRSACEVFPQLMVNGGVMVFDDFGCLLGADRAVLEHFSDFERTRFGKALVRVHGLAR